MKVVARSPSSLVSALRSIGIAEKDKLSHVRVLAKRRDRKKSCEELLDPGHVPGASTGASSVSSADLEDLRIWFEEEVKGRLVAIEEKLSKLDKIDKHLDRDYAQHGTAQSLDPEISVVPPEAPPRPRKTAVAAAAAAVQQMLFFRLREEESQDSDPVRQPLPDDLPSEELAATDTLANRSPSETVPQCLSKQAGSLGIHVNIDNFTKNVGSQRSCGSIQILGTHFNRLQTRSAAAKEAHLFLEEPESGTCAWTFSIMMQGFIVASVGLALLQTIHAVAVEGHKLVLGIFETAFDVVFTLELCLRFIVCPDRIAFFYTTYNCIDIVAGMPPLIVRALSGFICPTEQDNAAAHYFLLIILPALRLLKMLRRFQKFHLLQSAFKISLEALPFLLFILMLAVLVFSSMIYMVEPRDNIPTLPWAMWLTTISMTTIGYGDKYPVTSAGRVIISVLSIFSAMYMAVPLGIIGSSFSHVWGDRNRRLLTRRFRDRLSQAGFTAFDIPELFYMFDSDKDGHLSIPEFQNMISGIHAALTDADVTELFEIFDYNRSGSIDDYEFVRALWPNMTMKIYGGLMQVQKA